MGFRYSIENAFRMLEEAQGMKIKVKMATTNPNFTLEDSNRVSFFNKKVHEDKKAANAAWTETDTVKLLKDAWTDKHFTEDFTGAKLIESGILSASLVMVKDPDKLHEEYRNVSYIYTENDGEKKYYFVTSMRFPNRDIVEYELYLDSITTYLDSNSFGGFTKIDRKHYDRYKEKALTGATRTITDTYDSIALPATENGTVGEWEFDIELPNLTNTGLLVQDTDNIVFSDGDGVADVGFAQIHGQFIPWSALNIHNGLLDNGLLEKNIKIGQWITLYIGVYSFNFGDSISRVHIKLSWVSGAPKAMFYKGKVESHIKDTLTAYAEPNFDRSSGVWNKDPEMPIESLVFKQSLRASKATTDANYANYIKYFNVGSDINPKFAYMLKKVETANKAHYNVKGSLVDGGGGLISFLVPLHNQAANFTIGSNTWTSTTNMNNIDTLSTTNVNSFIVVDEPLSYHAEIMTDIGGGLWAITSSDSYHKDIAKLRIKNPMQTLLQIDQFKLDDIFWYEREVKLKSEEYMRLNLYAATGENKDLANFFIDTHKPLLEIDKSSIISETKSYGIFDLDKSYNKKLNDNQRILYTSHFEQLPSLSDPYKEYMNAHQSAFQTGITANRENFGLNMTRSVLSLNPMSMTRTGMSYAQKERQYLAQVKDLKRQGDEPIGSSTSLFRDNINQTLLGINNGVMLNIYEPIEVQKKAVAAHFNKFGYVSNELLQINSYADLSTRYRFSFWDTAKFTNVLDKTSLSTEIANDIASQFDSGITLWNVMDENGNTNVNDYSKENWENWIAGIAG